MAGLPVSINFRPDIEAPFDERSLSIMPPWERFGPDDYIYDGMPVVFFPSDPDVRGLYICWNKGARDLESSWQKIGGAVERKSETFTATAGQTTFTTTDALPTDSNLIDVFRNGVLIDFTKSGNTITTDTTDTIELNDIIKIKWITV